VLRYKEALWSGYYYLTWIIHKYLKKRVLLFFNYNLISYI
jgi:hypothetical protein